MKKILFATFLSLTLITPSISSAFAQIKITIPTTQQIQDLDAFQLEKISNFLEENQVTVRCLRRSQEDKDLTSITASCLVLQVFDASASQNQHWERAKSLKLVDAEKNKSETVTGFEFLSLLFKTAGVTVSPLSESNYRKTFRTLRIRLNPEQLKTLATALENGLIPEPSTQREAQELKRQLSLHPLKVRDALAYLYQVATSEHQESTIINITPYEAPSSTLKMEDVLREVFNMIKTQSYFSENFDEKKAIEAAIKAAVKTLDEDKYIEYYTAEEFQSFSEGLNGNLEGIGAYIEEKEGKIIIVSPIEGSPAQKAGLLSGDIITHIDGETTEGLTLQQAVNKIRGKEGTSVKLTIQRNGSTLEFTIQRNKITIPALTVSNRDNIEIIKLVQFGSTSAQEMKEELDTIAKKNPEGIIIDLRNNPGGFLNEVISIVDYFLEKNKSIVYIKDRHQENSMDSTSEPIITNIPISILINKGSASASEILAGVLQSYGLAKIYGETSYGKGTVQNIVSLQSKDQNSLSAFKFTTAEYLIATPNGGSKSINGVGIKPDSNPGGSPLLDNLDTPEDEALETVINSLKGFEVQRRR